MTRSRIFNAIVTAAAFASVSVMPKSASAEGYQIDTYIGGGSGLEGADPGIGELQWQRARGRISAGFDLRDSEGDASGFGFRAFAELEKRGSLGAEIRYERWLGKTVGVYGGFVGVLAPKTLLGVSAGVDLVVPLGQRFGVFIEPSFTVLPLGSDLPQDSVIMWGLCQLGVRLSF